MANYSEAFKAKMVQKLLVPGGPSAGALSSQVGVAQSTLSRWARKAGMMGGMSKQSRSQERRSASTRKPPHRWTAQEKLQVVLDAEGLDDVELGALLRTRGLHMAQLEAWRQAVQAAALKALGPPSKRRGKSPEACRVIELEKELRRKEKALAEAAALLVLKKKVQAIWGDEDDDTILESDK